MSLGESLYNSVKSSLIQAFSESETYKKLFEKYVNTDAFKEQLNQATTIRESFDILQKQLYDYEDMLKANGLGFRETNATTGEYLGMTSNQSFTPTTQGYDNNFNPGISITLYNNGVIDNDTTRELAKKISTMIKNNEKSEVEIGDGK